MSDTTLHQLSQELQQLRSDFDNHLVIEKIMRDEAALWRTSTTTQLNDLTESVNEVCGIIKDGKQSWRTLLFAGGVVISMFTFVIWAIKMVFEFKGLLK